MSIFKSFRMFLLLSILLLPSFAQIEDEQSVRDGVEKFCDAIVQKDVGKLKETTDGSWSDASFSDWQTEFDRGTYFQYPLRSFNIRSVKIEDEKATVRVLWERIDGKTNQPVEIFQGNHRLIYLDKQSSAWKVSKIVTDENDLIARTLKADSIEERKQLIRDSAELNTHRIIFVILFRLQNEGNYELTEEYYQLAEWYNDEFYKGKDEARFVNTILNILNSRALTQTSLGNYAAAMRLHLESAKIGAEFQMRTAKLLAELR